MQICSSPGLTQSSSSALGALPPRSLYVNCKVLNNVFRNWPDCCNLFSLWQEQSALKKLQEGALVFSSNPRLNTNSSSPTPFTAKPFPHPGSHPPGWVPRMSSQIYSCKWFCEDSSQTAPPHHRGCPAGTRKANKVNRARLLIPLAATVQPTWLLRYKNRMGGLVGRVPSKVGTIKTQNAATQTSYTPHRAVNHPVSMPRL